MKSQEEIYEILKPLLPPDAVHASGGLPDARGVSDVDISLLRDKHNDMLEQFPEGTTADSRDDRTIYNIPGYDRPVNVYAGNDKEKVKRALKHRLNELYLAKKYPELAAKAAKLKAGGLGTEPAWAQVMELEGDPYEAMLGPFDKESALSPDEVKHYMKTYYESSPDKAHGVDHIEKVREQMRKLVAAKKYKDAGLADAAALLHDIGVAQDRSKHETIGADLAAADPILQQRFNKAKLRLLVNAIKQHRASTGKPRSILGKMLSDSDRVAGGTGGERVLRAYKFRQSHTPEQPDDDKVREAAQHIIEKFGPGGYGAAASYYPETKAAIAEGVKPVIEAYNTGNLDQIRELAKIPKVASTFPQQTLELELEHQNPSNLNKGKAWKKTLMDTLRKKHPEIANVTGDPTLDRTGIEVTVPYQSKAQLKRVLRTLKDMKYGTSMHTGLHVHSDYSDASPADILKLMKNRRASLNNVKGFSTHVFHRPYTPALREDLNKLDPKKVTAEDLRKALIRHSHGERASSKKHMYNNLVGKGSDININPYLLKALGMPQTEYKGRKKGGYGSVEFRSGYDYDPSGHTPINTSAILRAVDHVRNLKK